MLKRFFSASLLLSCVMPGFAADQGVAVPPEVNSALKRLVPTRQPDHVRPAPLAGWYEVSYGPRVFYVTADGRFLVDGSLIDVQTGRNLTEERRARIRLDAIERLGEDRMIVFAPAGEVRRTITVFTDIDCPYCRRLHREVGALNEQGVKVRYLLFPRAGIGSLSYRKAVSVWCAEDRNAALTDAKAGKPVEERQCDNPVIAHMRLGEQLGVNGTPTIVTETGRVFPGYVPARELVALLDLDVSAAR